MTRSIKNPFPANIQSNKQVISASKRRYDVIIVRLLRYVFAALDLE